MFQYTAVCKHKRLWSCGTVMKVYSIRNKSPGIKDTTLVDRINDSPSGVASSLVDSSCRVMECSP